MRCEHSVARHRAAGTALQHLYEVREGGAERAVSRVASRLYRRRRRHRRRRRDGRGRGRRQRRVGRHRTAAAAHSPPTPDAARRRPLRRRRRRRGPAHGAAAARPVRQLEPVVGVEELGAVGRRGKGGVAERSAVEHGGVRVRQHALVLGVRLIVVRQLQLHATRTPDAKRHIC